MSKRLADWCFGPAKACFEVSGIALDTATKTSAFLAFGGGMVGVGAIVYLAVFANPILFIPGLIIASPCLAPLVFGMAFVLLGVGFGIVGAMAYGLALGALSLRNSLSQSQSEDKSEAQSEDKPETTSECLSYVVVISKQEQAAKFVKKQIETSNDTVIIPDNCESVSPGLSDNPLHESTEEFKRTEEEPSEGYFKSSYIVC